MNALRLLEAWLAGLTISPGWYWALKAQMRLHRRWPILRY